MGWAPARRSQLRAGVCGALLNVLTKSNSPGGLMVQVLPGVLPGGAHTVHSRTQAPIYSYH